MTDYELFLAGHLLFVITWLGGTVCTWIVLVSRLELLVLLAVVIDMVVKPGI